MEVSVLVNLALLVFIGAIVVFFSQEFTRLFKKVLSVKGATFVVPLALASLAVMIFESWFLWILYYYQDNLVTSVSSLAQYLPFHAISWWEASVVVLTLVAVIPVFLWDTVTHRRAFVIYQYPYAASTLIWLASAILLFVH